MHSNPTTCVRLNSWRHLSLPLLAACTTFAVVPSTRAQLAAASQEQNTPGSTPPVVAASGNNRAESDTVFLNPFEVSSTGDRGYQAQSSLGGSRLKTELKNIAAPTTAFTAQFLEDAAITNTDDLAKYMLSTEYDVGEDSGGQNRLGPSNRPLRVRGLAGGSYAVNFFKNDLRFDTFSLDRIDQSRGPNSVLFGVGSPGGIINVTTKRAVLSQEKTSVTVQGTTEKGLREEIDFNQPLIRDKLALRVAAVNTQEETWRNYEYDDQQRYFATLKWRIGRKTELNVEGEKGAIDKATKRTVTGYDAYTNWVAAGRNLGTAASVPLQIQRIVGANIPYVVFDTATGGVSNWVNKTSSVLRTSVDAEPTPLTDFNLVPKEVTFYGPGYNQSTSYARTSAFLTHSFTPDWNLELAALRMDRHGQVWDAQGPPQNYLKADTNATLPNGAVNPNAGQPYLEALSQVNNNSSRDDSLRAVMSYHRDLENFGKHTLAGVFQADYSRNGAYVTREQVISANAPNAQLENNNNRVFRRTYVNLAGPSKNIVMRNFQEQPISNIVDPASGIAYTTAFVPFNQNTLLNSNHGTSSIGMLQSSFWKDRINTVVGGSYDERTDFLGTQVRTPFPNFATGVLSPIRSHAATKSHAHSFSFSGVFHVTDWLGLTYSRSENSALPNFTGRIHSPDGLVPNFSPPTPRGKSQDAGFKLDILEHKVFLTATYFKTSDVKDFDFTPLATTTVNPIWTTLQANGVPAPAGYTYDSIITATGGLPTITDISTGATFDGSTHGVELELTANPTPNWRVFANFSHQRTTHSNIGPEELAYLALYRPLFVANAALPLTSGTGTIGSQLAALDNLVLQNFILADGKEPLGQSREKFNLRTSYDLTDGWMKGITVGGGARYNTAPVIGYFSTLDSSGRVVSNIRHGSDQIFFDGNISYRRKLTAFNRSVLWTLQLNVNNALNNDAFVKLRVSTIGETELYKFNPEREWFLSSKFAF